MLFFLFAVLARDCRAQPAEIVLEMAEAEIAEPAEQAIALSDRAWAIHESCYIHKHKMREKAETSQDKPDQWEFGRSFKRMSWILLT